MPWEVAIEKEKKKKDKMKGLINSSHHAIHYIPKTYLFYSWKFVPFNPLYLFHPPPSLTTDDLFSLSMSLVFVSLNSTYK